METKPFFDIYNPMPLIAILRGVEPKNIISVADVLIESGVTIIEIPLNSPNPYDSIEILSRHAPSTVCIGAGTVLTASQVQNVNDAGGSIVLSPNMNSDVIALTKKLGMTSVPGVATPTEAYQALDAGADLLKVFPACTLSPDFFSQVRAVLPRSTKLLAVGGVDEGNIPQFLSKGASGVGLGSCIYKPTDTPDAIRNKAKRLVALMQAELNL